jgi:outer membrane autotransporter protein
VGTGGSTIDTQTNTLTLTGAIGGTAALTKIGSGTLILSGASTYSGGTLVDAGTLGIGSNTALGSGAVTLVGTTLQAEASGLSVANTFALGAGGGVIDTQANTLTLTGVIGGATSLTKIGTGTLVLSGANTYSGSMLVVAGILGVGSNTALGNGGTVTLIGTTLQAEANTLSLANAVALGTGGGTIDTQTNILTLTGAIGGTTSLTKIGSGTLILSGASSYSGGTLVDAGTLAVGSNTALGSGALTLTQGTTLGFAANGLSIANAILFPDADPNIDTGANTETLAGNISGIGGLTKLGTGTLILTGADSYTGATDVAAGVLDVDGSLDNSVVTVASGATLAGSGTVGNVAVGTNAMLAPGSIVLFSKLSIANAISFAPGSFYRVNVNAAGATDSVVAGGTATIQGGTVVVNAVPGAYAPSTQYTILTANGGVSGSFSDVTSSLAFLTPTLTYDAHDVFLTLTLAVSPLNFASLGVTPNEQAVAGTSETFGSGSLVYDAILNLTAPQALAAFNALSGEIHASAVSSSFEDSRLPRDAIFDRLDSFEATPDPNAVASLTPMAPSGADGDVTVWGQGFGSRGQDGSNGNAATLDQSFAGLMVGADTNPDERSTVGAVFGYTNAWLNLDQRASSGTIESVFGGLYGAAAFDAIHLSGGLLYGSNDYDFTRAVAFPGFSNVVTSGYDGHTVQAFGEAGYRMDLDESWDDAWIEPFLGLLAMQIHTDSFAESGGAAALIGAAHSYDFGATTLGLKGQMPVSAATPLVLKGTLGWRHMFGEITPDTNLAFASASGTAFTIGGAPIARNSLIAEAGLAWTLSPNATVGLYYSGDIAGGTYDNVVKAKIEFTF